MAQRDPGYFQKKKNTFPLSTAKLVYANWCTTILKKCNTAIFQDQFLCKIYHLLWINTGVYQYIRRTPRRPSQKDVIIKIDLFISTLYIKKPSNGRHKSLRTVQQEKSISAACSFFAIAVQTWKLQLYRFTVPVHCINVTGWFNLLSTQLPCLLNWSWET